MNYTDIEIVANKYSIDSSKTLQAVRFLNDLGSILYFENDNLKNKVIINPQVNTLLS